MKFPRIRLPHSRFNLTLILTLLLLAVLAAEAYFVYSNMYRSLSLKDDEIAPSNVVRVDLKSYQRTIDLLDSLKSYQPPALNLKQPNPFK